MFAADCVRGVGALIVAGSTLAWPRPALAQAAKPNSNQATYDAQNPTWNPGELAPGTNTTWTFKTGTDNAIATLLVSSEGTTVGATPNGYAQIQLNAQDELPQPNGKTIGSNMSGIVRVASRTFNNQTCNDSLCPDMMEVLSGHRLRFTTTGTGGFSFFHSGSELLTLDGSGVLKNLNTTTFGIGPNGEESYQLGPLGMEIGGDRSGFFYPPRLAPADAMSSRRWVGGSLRVAQRIGVGCDIESPFGRAIDPGETRDEAGLCVQALGTSTNLGAFITTPVHDMSREGIALKIDTRDTANLYANVGISIVSGNAETRALVNGGTSGATALRVQPQNTNGTDYGVDVEAAAGVEHPLAVRVAGADAAMVCADGGVTVGGSCTKSKGAGTITVTGELFKDGDPAGLFEYIAQLRQELQEMKARVAALEARQR